MTEQKLLEYREKIHQAIEEGSTELATSPAHNITEEQTQKELLEVESHKKYLQEVEALKDSAQVYYEHLTHYRCYLTPWEKERFNVEAEFVENKVKDMRYAFLKKHNKRPSDKWQHKILLLEFKKLFSFISDDLYKSLDWMNDATLQLILSCMSGILEKEEGTKAKVLSLLVKEVERQKMLEPQKNNNFKDSLDWNDKKEYESETSKIESMKEALRIKYKQIASDRLVHEKLKTELKKIVDSSSDVT